MVRKHAIRTTLIAGCLALAGCHLLAPYAVADEDSALPADGPMVEAGRDAGDAGDLNDGPDAGDDLPWPPDLKPPPDVAPPPDVLPPPDVAPPPDQMLVPDAGCGVGLTDCGGVCVDLKKNPLHCGKCNAGCSPLVANACKGGKCICSSAGKACSGGLNCSAGKCICVPGGLCLGCCDGNVCRKAGTAQQSSGKCGLKIMCKACNDYNPCTDDTCHKGACVFKKRMPGTSCVGTPGRCDKNHKCCTGCLTGNNSCVTTPGPTYCGAAGSKCVNCKDGDSCNYDQCKAGKCQHPKRAPGTKCDGVAGKCDKYYKCCKGCLTGARLCKTVANNSYCGLGGVTCQSCKGATCRTPSCSAGKCIKKLAASGTSCSGGYCDSKGACCSGCLKSGTCKPGTASTACGKGLKSCGTCPAKTCQTANCSTGTCKYTALSGTTCTGGKCLAGSCCTGCISGGKCLLPGGGQTNTQCGKGGGTCAACGSGLDCLGGSCYCHPGGSCTKGCCSTDGTACHAGQYQTVCGMGGFCNNCLQVFGYGSSCIKGQCVSYAGSLCSACQEGQCCGGGTCRAGTTSQYCGMKGNCTDCSKLGQNECSAAPLCVTAPGSRYCSVPPKADNSTCSKGVCCKGICIAATVCK